MDFLQQWGFLIAGFVLLVFSGDYLVKGSVAIANRFKLAPMVVGLTIVAFGTSAPELIVSLNAAFSGHPEIALGNVIGSNIANIALVLGLTTIIITMPVKSKTLLRDWGFMVAVSILFMIMLYSGRISATEGLILFGLLIAFIVFSIKTGDKTEGTPDEKPMKLWLAIVFIAASSVGLAFGADLLVKGASNIAGSWGVSERVISVTIVAFGTSLPELVASIISAIRKQTDISIGNIVGSNLFNILAVIGLTSSIKPIEADFSKFQGDFVWMIGVAVLLILLIQPIKRINKGSELNRWGGILLFSLYLIYVYLLF